MECLTRFYNEAAKFQCEMFMVQDVCLLDILVPSYLTNPVNLCTFTSGERVLRKSFCKNLMHNNQEKCSKLTKFMCHFSKGLASDRFEYLGLILVSKEVSLENAVLLRDYEASYQISGIKYFN